jgi:hypothetical protein
MGARRALSDVFLIDRRHVHFVSGRTWYLPGNGTWGMVLFLLLFQASGFVFAGRIGREIVASAHLRWDGRPAMATVTDLRARTDTDGQTYEVGYHLQVPQAAGSLIVSGQDRIPEAIYDTLLIQGPVPVTYSASSPAIVRAQAATWQQPLAILYSPLGTLRVL